MLEASDLYGDFMLDEDRDWVVWVGEKLPHMLQDREDLVKALVTSNDIVEYPIDFEPIMDYFRPPHTRESAMKWLTDGGAPRNALDIMAGNGDILGFNAKRNKVSDFKGIVLSEHASLEDGGGRLINYPTEDRALMRGLGGSLFGLVEADRTILHLLYGNEEEKDVPTIVTETSVALGQPETQVIRVFYHWLPVLLYGGYASLLHDGRDAR